MILQVLSFPKLVRMQAQTLQASTGRIWNLAVGSTVRAIFEANASVALWMQWLIVLVARQTRLATSNGTDVDTFIADFGMVRLPATYATGFATFSRLSAGIAASIPAGTVVLTADRSQSFVVTGPGPYAVPAAVSSVQVPVQASLSGLGGNIQAGTLGLIASAIPGVDTVSNGAPFVGGIGAESDPAVRTRFALFVDSRSRGTASAIAYVISSFQQGVTYTLQQATDSGGAVRPGSFVVAVDDGTGSPPASLLTSIYTAIDSVRPVGTAFAVVAPTLIPAIVNLTVAPAAGYSKQTIVGPVAVAVVAYINGLPLGSALDYTRIAWAAYAVPGVDNVTGVLLNGAVADVGGLSAQVVRTTLAQVSVT